jgi:uncharacterized protein YdeI (YjbR/CyaY-like superfamily)
VSRLYRAVKPTFFRSPAEFRRWLERRSGVAEELLVGFYKTGSGKPSITWPESVDEALCFGWIDFRVAVPALDLRSRWRHPLRNLPARRNRAAGCGFLAINGVRL